MVKIGWFEGMQCVDHVVSVRNVNQGVSLYSAPECRENKTCMKSDVWSFGMVALVLAEGLHVFVSRANVAIDERLNSLLAAGWSSAFVDFVRMCLVKDVDQRASVDMLLEVSVVMCCDV